MRAFASIVAAAATTTIFTDYPGFVNPNSTVQSYPDKGPIIEIVVRCPAGSGILSYSKIERVYCSAKHRCFAALSPAVDHTCR